MDNPEEAGIMEVAVCAAAQRGGGRLQNAAGWSAEICTKLPWNM